MLCSVVRLWVGLICCCLVFGVSWKSQWLYTETSTYGRGTVAANRNSSDTGPSIGHHGPEFLHHALVLYSRTHGSAISVLSPWFSTHQSPSVHQDSGLYLKELIEPVLTCFNDADSRLRYYACEALYNIVKVARGSVLPHFNVLFDGLSKVRSFL